MRLAVLYIWLGAIGTISVCVAENQYSFGPVPPPSEYSGDTISTTRAALPVVQSVTPTNVPEITKPVVTPVVPAGVPVASTSVEPAVTNAEQNLAVAVPVQADLSPKADPPPFTPLPVNAATSKLIVEPGEGIDGKVELVDAQGRFAVLNFPLGQMPATGNSLNAYRHGVKVGEVTITGPQRDDNTVADVISGDLKTGDSVRNR